MGVAIIMPLFASPCFVLFESSLCGGEGEVRRKRREISDGGEGEKAGRGGKKRGAVSVCTVLCREGSRGWNAAWKVKVNRPWQKRRRGRRGWERLCGETPGAAPAGPAAVRSGTGRSERAPSVAGVLRAGALRRGSAPGGSTPTASVGSGPEAPAEHIRASAEFSRHHWIQARAG